MSQPRSGRAARLRSSFVPTCPGQSERQCRGGYEENGTPDGVITAFRSRFRRSDVSSAAPADIRPISRGVHGFGGKWLVNGAGRGILQIELRSPPRAYVMGIPLRLRELLVSVGDPAALAKALCG